jgi:hypothetical protein
MRTLPSTERSAPSSVTSEPAAAEKLPRNVETPKCLTPKPIEECTGSIDQVPVGISIATVLDISFLLWSWNY